MSNKKEHLFCKNLIWSKEQNKTKNFHKSSCVIGALSIIGSVLNILVLARMISQDPRRSHFSKLYYLSLAVADFIVATCSIGYVFVFTNVVDMDRGSAFWYLSIGIAWVSITASLLHIVFITTDRFVATMFPLFHHNHRDIMRRKIAVEIMCIWIGSIILVLSMYWEHRIAFWCGAVCIPAASVGIVVTYTHIIIVSIKKQITRRTGQPVNRLSIEPVHAEDIRNSMNTVLLGFFVTLTYMVCNIPVSVAVYKYVRDKTCPEVWDKVIIHAFLTANTVLDPLLYALFDVVLVIQNRIRVQLRPLFTIGKNQTDVKDRS